MKEMSVKEFETNFSQVIEEVRLGEQITVTFGENKQVIGYFMPESSCEKPKRN